MNEERNGKTLEGAPPVFGDVGVVAFVPDDWDCKWQPRHQVLSRLARYFHVAWVSPAYPWPEALGLRARRTLPPRPASPGPGFRDFPPVRWLPKFYGPLWLVHLTERSRFRLARAWLRRMGCRTIILYLWRPEFSAVLAGGGFDLACYHVDDEYSFSTEENPVSGEERRVLESADQVFIHSPALLDKKGRINPHTAHIPNGVDFRSFSSPVPEPADLAAIPHPRVGYSGWLKPQIDWELLLSLAAKHTEWQFVFVGGVHPRPDNVEAVRKLRELPNVHVLGSKDTQELARYPQHFDVCIMPYRRDDYTKFIYPLKVHEYLASGRPVVGTPLPSLEEFAAFVALPESSGQWSAAIAASLRPEANTPEQRQIRQRVARAHDWDVLVERIAKTMAERLHPAVAQRFTSLVLSSGLDSSEQETGRADSYASAKLQ